MAKKLEEIIIPKENAVFWMDEQGDWHNQHGKFQHKKIIDYFHSSIEKDKQGYYVSQVNNNIKEKVYFNYKDTALFIFNVEKDLKLILNTKKKIKLKPKKIFIENNNLYIRIRKEKAKFVKRGLQEISKIIDYEKMTIKINNKEYKIKEIDSS